jgi:hypothetical protein
VGAILGAASGHILKDIFEKQIFTAVMANPTAIGILAWLIPLLGSVLLGVVVVIAFSRKKDAQPILAIEDFWGGLFIGVMAGYGGKAALSQFVTTETGTSQ